MSQPGAIIIIPGNGPQQLAAPPPPPQPQPIPTLPVQHKHKSSGDSTALVGFAALTAGGLIGAGALMLSQKYMKSSTNKDVLTRANAAPAQAKPQAEAMSLREYHEQVKELLPTLHPQLRRDVLRGLISHSATQDEFHFNQRLAHDLVGADQVEEFKQITQDVARHEGFELIDVSSERASYQEGDVHQQRAQLSHEMASMQKLMDPKLPNNILADREQVLKRWIHTQRTPITREENKPHLAMHMRNVFVPR